MDRATRFVAKFDPSAGGAASLIYATPLGGTAPPGLTVSAAATALCGGSFWRCLCGRANDSRGFPDRRYHGRSSERLSADLCKLPDVPARSRTRFWWRCRKCEPAAERLFQRGKRDLSRRSPSARKTRRSRSRCTMAGSPRCRFPACRSPARTPGFFADRAGRMRGTNHPGAEPVLVRGGIRSFDNRARRSRGELHRQCAGKSASARTDRRGAGRVRLALDQQHQFWQSARKYNEPERSHSPSRTRAIRRLRFKAR